ncbi:Aspartate/glutamate/uridylate kinase [Mycena olivaceomarginata]|nr:Aspartate/glutamate/uridylate kinase [Mycena olivaceomarginata]
MSLSSSSSSSSPATPPNLHQNSIDPKFGGTSVGKFAANIARDIVSGYIDSNKVAIVCSARSGSTKALGTTNLLLRAASETLKRPNARSGYTTPVSNGILWAHGGWVAEPAAEQPAGAEAYPWASGMSPLSNADELPEFHATVDLIRQEHFNAARQLEAEIERDCEWLRSFLYASQVCGHHRGLGERLACKIMTAVLRDQGIEAEYVSLENIVPDVDDDDDGALDQDFYDQLSLAVGERVKQCGARVPVVTGFFGPVPGSLLQQVGRGYTDLLSALLAVGLEAAELQIWKEVDGIFTADPRKLTYYGSEVVHPFTMEQAIRRKIPIRIKNVENPRGGGTVIHPDPGADMPQVEDDVGSVPEPASPLTLALLAARASAATRQHPRHPTAVTIKERIVVLNINSNRKSVSHGFLAGIFGTLDRFGVVVDLISTSEVHVSMAIEDALNKKIFERLLRELQKSGTVSVHHNMAILSLVGKHMCNMIGIAGRMFTTLAQGSQGASEINISCVIDAKDAVKALNLIHQSCLQPPETSHSCPRRSNSA